MDVHNPIQKVSLEWQRDFRFVAHAGETSTEIDGEGKTGPTPVNTLLEAIGACAAIDVVDILAKGRQELEGLSVKVSAERRAEPPRSLRRLEMQFRIKGPVDLARARRAVDLSLEKYCSVLHSLRMDLAVDVDVEVVS